MQEMNQNKVKNYSRQKTPQIIAALAIAVLLIGVFLYAKFNEKYWRQNSKIENSQIIELAKKAPSVEEIKDKNFLLSSFEKAAYFYAKNFVASTFKDREFIKFPEKEYVSRYLGYNSFLVSGYVETKNEDGSDVKIDWKIQLKYDLNFNEKGEVDIYNEEAWEAELWIQNGKQILP